MKNVILLIILLNAIICFGIFADIEKVDTSIISGTWVKNNLYYSFDDQGIMKSVKIDSEPVSYDTYRYEIISMGNHELIRYGKDLTDSASVKFLYISEIEDSIAVLGYGRAFIKADSIQGLKGSWKHNENLSSIYWNIDRGLIDYRHEILNLNSGEFDTVEEHQGVYTIGEATDEAGRFYIDFMDGKKAVVIPIFYNNLMYMFDLSPGRATFNLSESAPSYNDYKKASNKY